MSNNRYRIGLIAGVALLALSLALAGCVPGGRDVDAITVSLDKSDDRATVTRGDNHAVIDVTSASGIGGLAATAEQWPEEVVVRLHVRGLEGLTIRYGDFIIVTGVSSTGDPVALSLSVVDAEGNVQSASPSADVYYPDIQAVTPDGTADVGPLAAGERPAFPLPEGGALEITLPPHFHRDDHPSFTLQWIDFYR